MKNTLLVVGLFALLVLVFSLTFPMASGLGGFADRFLPGPSERQSPGGGTENTTGLTVPEGFSIRVFADGMDKPRDITRGPDGRLLVSDTDAGTVVALGNAGAGGAGEANVVLDQLDAPHGIVSHCRTVSMGDQQQACVLYVAEEGAVLRFPYDFESGTFGEGERILTLPRGGGHSTRSLLITDRASLRAETAEEPPRPGDEILLVSIGSSCNVCFEEHEWRAAVIAAGLDGSNPRVVARGLRNAVFLERHPVDGRVWVSEMGRDWLGDDLPPDEVNILTEGGDYGWPICYGKQVHDTVFDDRQYLRDPCADTTSSHIDVLPAHSAPLGLAFVPEDPPALSGGRAAERAGGWPEEYWFDMVLALHGSWNRTEPSGYKVVRYELAPDGSVVRNADGSPVVRDFVTGFRTPGGRIIGRPADVYLEPGGTGYLSDDHSGRIYQITRTGADES